MVFSRTTGRSAIRIWPTVDAPEAQASRNSRIPGEAVLSTVTLILSSVVLPFSGMPSALIPVPAKSTAMGFEGLLVSQKSVISLVFPRSITAG